MFACLSGHKDVVQLLLDHPDKIDLNAKENDGWTAFIYACYRGHKDVVKLLLEYPELVNINISEKMIISEEIKNLIEIHSMKFQI